MMRVCGCTFWECNCPTQQKQKDRTDGKKSVHQRQCYGQVFEALSRLILDLPVYKDSPEDAIAVLNDWLDHEVLPLPPEFQLPPPTLSAPDPLQLLAIQIINMNTNPIAAQSSALMFGRLVASWAMVCRLKRKLRSPAAEVKRD